MFGLAHIMHKEVEIITLAYTLYTSTVFGHQIPVLPLVLITGATNVINVTKMQKAFNKPRFGFLFVSLGPLILPLLLLFANITSTQISTGNQIMGQSGHRVKKTTWFLTKRIDRLVVF